MPVEIKYNGSTIANLEGGQTATLPCNGKKMKSDLTVIAPEGGGECSGNHIIEVAELPEVGVEGAVYQVPAITDIIAIMYGYVIPMSALAPIEPTPVIVTTSAKFPPSEIGVVKTYYVTDIPEAYAYKDGAWVAMSTEMGACRGDFANISNIDEIDTTTNGHYLSFGNALFKYEGGQYKRLATKGGFVFSSNGDGTCSVDNLEPNYDLDIVIPSISPDGETVTAISGMPFNSNVFKSITIPNTVTNISEDAFTATLCNKIIVADGITEICAKAFNGAKCLEYELPNSLTKIGDRAFSGNSYLYKITIPASVTSIGKYVFDGCSKLTTFKFSGTIEQWNAIEKGGSVGVGSGVTKVVCSDGDVTL